jgi:hypothetical protein
MVPAWFEGRRQHYCHASRATRFAQPRPQPHLWPRPQRTIVQFHHSGCRRRQVFGHPLVIVSDGLRGTAAQSEGSSGADACDGGDGRTVNMAGGRDRRQALRGRAPRQSHDTNCRGDRRIAWPGNAEDVFAGDHVTGRNGGRHGDHGTGRARYGSHTQGR